MQNVVSLDPLYKRDSKGKVRIWTMEVGFNKSNEAVSSRGVGGADVNRGKLCLKGIMEHELFTSAGRGNKPLIRQHWHQDFVETIL